MILCSPTTGAKLVSKRIFWVETGTQHVHYNTLQSCQLTGQILPNTNSTDASADRKHALASFSLHMHLRHADRRHDA